MTATLEGGEWSATRPGRTLPPGKTRYPLYRRLGGSQGRIWKGEKSRPHQDSIPDRPARSQYYNKIFARNNLNYQENIIRLRKEQVISKSIYNCHLSLTDIYRVSQEECARLREGVPYVKVYRYNPKHLCPKLNGYGDNGQ